jgi:uncharacterized protein
VRRRRFIQAIGAGSATWLSANSSSTSLQRYVKADEDIDYDDSFEKTDWGYVRHNWDPPDGTDNPILYRPDGYMGASFAPDGPTHYIRMPDDTLIATKISGSGRPEFPEPDSYIRVESSVRATACSAGDEDAFGEAYDVISHGQDGYELIEWLANRSWALDRIGLWGISYSGMKAIRVAERNPPSLGCVSANVIMGDILRGRSFPGGVDNLAFDNWLNNLPSLWWDDDNRNIVPDDDSFCQEYHGNRDAEGVIDAHPNWYRDRTENDGYRRINFVRMARHIDVPTYISQAWQDGQVGQRGGPAVYNALDPEPVTQEDIPSERLPSPELRDSPKLFRATNGYHGNGVEYLWQRDAKRWFDYWLLGEETGIMQEDPVRVTVNRGPDTEGSTIGLDGLPASNTNWRRLFFSSDSTLSRTIPAEGADTYVSEVPSQWFIEDLTQDNLLTFWSEPMEEPQLIAGTSTVTLFVEADDVDTEFYVSVGDIEPNMEEVTYLQRGMLRASHRELRRESADEPLPEGLTPEYTEYNENGAIIRPVHTMTEPTQITPGEIYRYDIEVFPFSHVLYPGHRLLINIHAPPEEEGPDGLRYWMYDSLTNSAEHTLHYGDEYRSSILLPTFRWGSEENVPPEPSCGEPEGYNCIDVELPSH